MRKVGPCGYFSVGDGVIHEKRSLMERLKTAEGISIPTAQEPPPVKLHKEAKPLSKKAQRKRAWNQKMRERMGYEHDWLHRRKGSGELVSFHTIGAVVSEKLLSFDAYKMTISGGPEGRQEIEKIDTLCMAAATNYGWCKDHFEVDEQVRTQELIPEPDPGDRYEIPEGLMGRAIREREQLRCTLLDGTVIVGGLENMSKYSFLLRVPDKRSKKILLVFKHALYHLEPV